METKPYHHLSDGTFRNPEGSPVRSSSFNWSFKIFNEEKKKLDTTVPDDHVIKKTEVLNNLSKFYFSIIFKYLVSLSSNYINLYFLFS